MKKFLAYQLYLTCLYKFFHCRTIKGALHGREQRTRINFIRI